jgi:mRNA interferase RelE/StbE
VAWKIEFDHNAAHEFKKLDKNSQSLISSYLKNKVLKSAHPKDLGKPLRHDFSGLWRFRVDKFRIVCSLEEHNLIILVLKIGKRDDVYD